jgi:anti-sigma factor RsiW
MSTPITESILIDYLEGDLAPAAAQAFEQRLKGDPRAAALVARLRADRDALAGTPAPELPRDFVAELETMISRPMLIESHRPGEYRRQQQQVRARARSRLVVRRLAQAAGIVLLVGIGWMAAVLVTRFDLIPDNRLVILPSSPFEAAAGESAESIVQTDRNQRAGSVQSAGLGDATFIPAPESLVHHRWPEPLPSMAAGDGTMVSGGTMSAPAEPIAFEVAMVMTGDVGVSEALLVAHVNRTTIGDSLVRNVVIDDTQMASAQPGPLDARGGGAGTSSTLAGNRSIGPNGAAQIKWSDAGATLTITLPARELAAFIESMSSAAPAGVGWRALVGEGASKSDPLVQFGAAATARAQLRDILKRDPSAWVMLPVVVE